jgi:hypothetical protein
LPNILFLEKLTASTLANRRSMSLESVSVKNETQMVHELAASSAAGRSSSTKGRSNSAALRKIYRSREQNDSFRAAAAERGIDADKAAQNGGKF